MIVKIKIYAKYLYFALKIIKIGKYYFWVKELLNKILIFSFKYLIFIKNLVILKIMDNKNNIWSCMNKATIVVNNTQKQKSFNLIKIIMEDYSKTLDTIKDNDASNDLFMKTTKHLISNFNQEVNEILVNNHEKFELSIHSINIFKETLDFYWSNSKDSFVEYSETDFINAQRLLSGTHVNIFVK